ncbi:MAG: FkbM family methyltransferase [Deltaproteobacteria bacterium]|nr:FkbM family methyltransferase [Deltaproteobacteria bacterium]
MKKDLDEQWLYNQTKDDESLRALTTILQQRQYVYEHNRFIGGDTLSSLNLDRYRVWFRGCSAFSTLEVYYEIFKEENHFLLPEFSGLNETVVIDIGANEGFYALKIKERNPACRVICVEPNPYLFEVMQNNVESNRLNNIELVNKALAANQGTSRFDIIKEIGPIGGRGLKLVDRPWLREEFIRSIQVETATLDDLFARFDLPGAGILKIDVEGMELEVLDGARTCLALVDKVVIERHSRNLRDGVVDFLTAHGFRLVYEEDPDITRYYGDLYFIKRKGN